jgi:hypothetical protein
MLARMSSSPSSSISEMVHSNFLLVGHLFGIEKDIDVSPLLSLRITSQASELKNIFAQSKLEGLSKEAIKQFSQPKATSMQLELRIGAKNFAHNLTHSAWQIVKSLGLSNLDQHLDHWAAKSCQPATH